jgi:hypothetical protein
MAVIRIEAEGPVGAPAERVYAILADYRQHHPRILPDNFSELTVEQGGVGEGTVFRYKMKVAGQTREARTQVTEPQPGRVLTESDAQRGIVTSFIVTPEGTTSRVRIETYWEKGGVGGLVDRLMAPRLLRPIYADELARLDRYAREMSA